MTASHTDLGTGRDAAPDKTAQIVDSALDTNAVEKADVAVAMRAVRFQDHPAVRAAGRLSEVADQPPMFALSTAALAVGLATGDPRLARTGARLIAAIALVTGVKSLIKLGIARTRPSKALDQGRYEARMLGPNEGPWNSFPSGHTGNAVAAARVIARAYPEAAAPAYATAAAIGLIQVPRGAHYPIDVAAGALIGWGAEEAVEAAVRRLGLEG